MKTADVTGEDDVWSALGNFRNVSVLICGFVEEALVVQVGHELDAWAGRVAELCGVYARIVF